MSKKKATDFELTYIHPSKPHYLQINFLDKNKKILRSSVDVVLNSLYLTNGEDDWDYGKLDGFVKTR